METPQKVHLNPHTAAPQSPGAEDKAGITAAGKAFFSSEMAWTPS